MVVPQMQAIIDRWGNPLGRNNFIFPVLDGTEDAMHQKLKTMYLTRAINKRMQEVGEQLGIGNISTYTARHSFATACRGEYRLYIGKPRPPRSENDGKLFGQLRTGRKGEKRGYFDS